MICWIYAHLPLTPSPFSWKKGEIWPWRVINPISKPRSLWFRTKLLGLWQSRGANISVLNIAGWQNKPSCKTDLRTLTFHSPDLFEDILAGDKKDIAGSHQLPRLHDDGRLETIFHICCYPPLLRYKENQEKKKSSERKLASFAEQYHLWKQHLRKHSEVEIQSEFRRLNTFCLAHHLPPVCTSLLEVDSGCDSTTSCSCNFPTDKCDVYLRHILKQLAYMIIDIIDGLLILAHLLEFPFGEFWMEGRMWNRWWPDWQGQLVEPQAGQEQQCRVGVTHRCPLPPPVM